MKILLLGSLLLSTLPALACAGVLETCRMNDVVFSVSGKQGASHFQMNSNLYQILKSQLPDFVEVESEGSGHITSSDGAFSAGVPKAYSLYLTQSADGMLLTYVSYLENQFQIKPATFYFNAGQCAIKTF